MNDDGAGEEGWQWPAALDALTAAPRHHTLLLENERVRVLDTRIAPGETVPLHTHRWPAVLHILSWGDFIRRDQNRNVTLDTRTLASPPASIVWSATAAAAHAGERRHARDSGDHGRAEGFTEPIVPGLAHARVC
jgi:hypothetical protein